MRPIDAVDDWYYEDYLREPEIPEYWSETRRPLVCLVFLLPLLAIYELGVLYFGGKQPEAIRNGADSWMRCWLSLGGSNVNWLLPGLVVGGLLTWHVASRQRWRMSADVPFGMLAESLLYAFVLLFIGQVTDIAFQRMGVPATLSAGEFSRAAMAVTFIGAGIYEEFLFRLCLLPACIGGLRIMRLGPVWALVMAVLSTSLTFSLAHYVGSAAETFDLFTFTFRTIAGAFFAVLFVTRGFGVAVGCHATYDLLVGVLLNAQG